MYRSRKKQNRIWTGTRKKRGPDSQKKKNLGTPTKRQLAESDRGSWYNQGQGQTQQQCQEDSAGSKSKPTRAPSASRKKLKITEDDLLDNRVENIGPKSDGLASESETESSDSDEQTQPLKGAAENDHYLVIDKTTLQSALDSAAICKYCGSAGLDFLEGLRYGIGSQYVLRCSNSDCASQKHELPFHTTPKRNRVYEANLVEVLAFRLIGRGRTAALKFSSVLNFPRPVNKTPWSSHTKRLEELAKELMESEFQTAALEAKRFVWDHSEEKDCELSDRELKDKVLNVGVSLDGSWNSRGWSSRDGIVAAISIDTRKVLDVVYLSRSCNECVSKEHQQKEGDLTKLDYLTWYLKHEKDCFLNHDGSAQSMESEGCSRLYGRSIKRHNIRYIPFVGDGDSKGYSAVCKLKPYGPSVYIPKEDCIGHVTKRMGNHLRKLQKDHKGKKLSDGKALGGKGRLNNERIKALENFYGKAIRENKGSAKKMAKATQAIIKHYSSTLENPRHEDCPEGADSFCSYQREKATKKPCHKPIKNALAPAIIEVLQPIFDKLGDEKFLAGCEQCLTQNANESLHHVVWGLAPKEVYTSQQEISLSVSLGVLIFNNGMYCTMMELFRKLELGVTEVMRREWKDIDLKRVKDGDYKCSEKVRTRRKKRKMEISKTQDAFVHDEGPQYKSNSFYESEKAGKKEVRQLVLMTVF